MSVGRLVLGVHRAARPQAQLLAGGRAFASGSSPLTLAAEELRAPLLTACSRGRSVAGEVPRWPPVFGDWSSVRQQAEAVAAWPLHPLEPAERLALASNLASSAAAALSSEPSACGERMCAFYEKLLEPCSLIVPRDQGVAHCGVVAVLEEGSLQAACCEAVSLLLSGHAVSLAAAAGPQLEAAREIVQGFPPELLQAAEVGPLITLPMTVRALRTVGPAARDLWTDRAPPGDFGGISSGTGHGMAMAAAPLSMAKVDTAAMGPRPLSEFSSEALELVKMLPAKANVEGGLTDVRDFLDLLWGFREAAAVGHADERRVSLAPAHKHILLTFCGTHVPEDIVKAAIISAMSPFKERVTLHTVGLGSRGLSREPLGSFCRLVQSGRGGLEWNVTEHKDWACFLDWLQLQSDVDDAEPVSLFSLLRNLESEVKRRCAQAGGVAWVQMLTPEPLENLRRWTNVLEVDKMQE